MIIRMAESGLLPDRLVRGGIRHLLKRRLSQESGRREDQERLFQELSRGPVAIAQDEANEQHYEVDSRFYDQVLGPHLKYSSGYWGDGVTDLAGAEEAMLALTGERAELANGQEILELGCGWGSLTLWMAAHYPGSRITAVSNSASQKAWITERAAERGLDNLRVITADVTVFQPERRYDRVVRGDVRAHAQPPRADAAHP